MGIFTSRKSDFGNTFDKSLSQWISVLYQIIYNAYS